jgi:hypothetical protein
VHPALRIQETAALRQGGTRKLGVSMLRVFILCRASWDAVAFRKLSWLKGRLVL